MMSRQGIQNVSEKDEVQGLSQFHLAAERGDTEAVRRLLMSSANADVLDVKYNTPLHCASLNGHVDVVNLLLSKKSSVNACNNAKMTPLHLACEKGHTSIVKILLDNHAIVDVTKQSELTPLFLSAKNGHAEVTDLLLHRGVCDFVLINISQTPLHVAVKEGHSKVVEVILKHSCRISDKLTKDGQKLKENAKNLIETSGIQPIQLLRSDSRHVSAGIVWKEKSKPLEICGDFPGETALDLAVLSIQPKMVKLLLNADQCAYSEVHLRRNLDCLIRTIIGHGITDRRYSKETPNVQSDDDKEKMFSENTKEMARALINSSRFNVNHQDLNGQTPLHEIMPYIDWLHSESEKKIQIKHLIQLLLQKGADFNMKDSDGETPLMFASRKGDCDFIQILFDWEHKSGMKLELDARDQHEETALMIAAEGNHVSAMRMLLNHKASVNLQDHYGFTVLHAVVYEPNTNWSDFYFFCKGLCKNYLRPGRIATQRKEVVELDLGAKTVDPQTVIDRLQSYLEDNEGTIRLREEMVKLLLAKDETNVNAVDFRGNTPLDLAVKSSKRISSAILQALQNRGAIRKLQKKINLIKKILSYFQEPEDEAPIEEARVDERGRNPLHRLIISSTASSEREQLRFMLNGILISPENFRESATATDYKGRTPLHYAVMPAPRSRVSISVLLELASEVNAVDMYGKTPLHYAEDNSKYKLLVQNGADESIKDRKGHTPRDLKQLRESVTINEDNAKKLTIENPDKDLYLSTDIAQVLNTNHVTELNRWKLLETIRIYSQSPRPGESSEEAIWKLWTNNDPIRLNRRLGQLKPSVQHFFERLADGIKEKDWRFECQPILVGSANEGTKVVISGDFDFSFKLIEFSQLCDPFPHPQAPKGYFQLRRKTNEDTKSRSDEMFDSFFNLHHCLLTYEVYSRFKIILEEVLSDPAFWKGENRFDWSIIHKDSGRYGNLDGLSKNVLLRMIHPIEDGEGGFLFVNISIDIVACVHVKDWWPEDPLPVGISPTVKANGCTFILHRSRFDPLMPRGPRFTFSETLARISFAPVESRIIKECSPLIKAAYIICNMILYAHSKTTYQMKTGVLFCMEVLNARYGGGTRITPRQLSFWVERLMFCFMEFSRRGIYPTYFMPSFRQRALQMPNANHTCLKRKYDFNSEDLRDFGYCSVFGLYLDLCPDGSTFDIPIKSQDEHRLIDRSTLDPNGDPILEQFDRE